MTHDLAGRAGLLEILSWARPHDSATERAFCREYLDRVPGMRADGFGNRMLEVGERPRILWSCHVDTVAAVGGHQAVGVDEHGIAHLCAGKAGMSLGADDGAGLWIMLGMIAAARHPAGDGDRARLDSAGNVAAPEAGQDHAIHDLLRSGVGQAVRQVAPDHDPRLPFVWRDEQQDAAVRDAAAVGDRRGKAGNVDPAERGRGDDDQRMSASLVEGRQHGIEPRLAVGGQDVRFVGDAPLHDAEGDAAFALPHGIGGAAGAQVDADDARRLVGAVDRHIPDARGHPVRQPDRRFLLGAAAIGEARFQRAPIDAERDGADGKIFVMAVSMGVRTLALPAHAFQAPIMDRPFDLPGLSIRHRLRDAALVPPRHRARREDCEDADRHKRIACPARFAETPFHHRAGNDECQPDQRELQADAVARNVIDGRIGHGRAPFARLNPSDSGRRMRPSRQPAAPTAPPWPARASRSRRYDRHPPPDRLRCSTIARAGR